MRRLRADPGRLAPLDGGSSRRTTVMRLCPWQPAYISLIRRRRRLILRCAPSPSETLLPSEDPIRQRIHLTVGPSISARLVLRPVFRVGKVPPLEVGAKQVDQILSQATQVRDDGDGLPATAVVVKTQAVLASAEWGTTCDWVAVVHEDVQVSAARADGHVRVVP